MIEKDYDQKDYNRKYCDNWKALWWGFWWLKRIMMIEKDYDNWKRLWLNKFMLVIGWILVVM